MLIKLADMFIKLADRLIKLADRLMKSLGPFHARSLVIVDC